MCAFLDNYYLNDLKNFKSTPFMYADYRKGALTEKDLADLVMGER